MLMQQHCFAENKYNNLRDGGLRLALAVVFFSNREMKWKKNTLFCSSNRFYPLPWNGTVSEKNK